MTTALVVGAGVAGPVTVMALRKAGIDARLFEAHPTGADLVGSWLTLQANGIDALRAVDAHHVVERFGFAQPTLTMLSGRGKVLGTMSNGEPLPDGTPTQMLRRADLYTALRDEAVARGARVELGRRLVGARRERGRVVATFADGGTAEGDLLIGADGIHSRVRTLVDPAAPPPRFVPVLNTGGYVPDLAVDSPPGEFRMVFGRRCFHAWVATPDGGVVWFANPPATVEPTPEELRAVPDAEWRRRLLALTADDVASPFAEIVRRAPGPVTVWPTHDLPRVQTWHRDGMVVIGDAAHATSPSSGQGAAMALEDAVLLPRFLRDAPTVEDAFRGFEALRRPRVERIVRWGARSSSSKAAGPVGAVVRDAMMPLVLRLAARASTAWIHSHHVEWDEPSVVA